ncbi:monothiol glutaredoxin-5 [Hymenopellis radicata]|nr:monothiol glutaredoxin-5 [Hymenopellis radicata]
MFGTVLKTSLLRPSLSKTLVSSQRVAWRRFLSDDVRAKIHQAVHEKPVVLFMKGTPDMPQCGFSRAAIQVLSMWQVPPEKMKTYDVLADNELRNSIKEYSEWPTIPQLYVNGEFVGGCDILLSMHQNGELETLLENNDIIPKESVEASS